MSLSSTSRVQMSYIKETAFGVTPVTGVVKNLRNTGETLNYTVSKTSSAEINSYRATSSMIPTSAEAAGAINIELSFGEYDSLMEAALQGAWEPVGTLGVSAVFSATLTATTITASVSNTEFALLDKGQWFNLGGTGTANDGKLFRVSKTVAPTTTIITLDTSTPATVGGPFAATVLKGARLSNGVVQPSFTIQRAVTDADEFFSFRGMTVGSMSMNIASGSITTGDFNFMGRDSLQNNVTFMPSAPFESQAKQVMSGVSGTTCALWVGGVPLVGTFINSIALSYDNALRQQTALCTLGSVGIGVGTIAPTLDLEVYFASGATFYDELLSNANLEVAFTAFDAEGNGYIYTFPLCNVSSYTVNAGGQDADLLAQISLTPLLDLANATANMRKVMFIDRVGAAMVL